MRTTFRLSAAIAATAAALALTGAGSANAAIITNSPNFVTVAGNQVSFHLNGSDKDFDNYCHVFYGPSNVVDLWTEQRTGVRSLSPAEQSQINNSLIDGRSGKVSFGYVHNSETVTPLDANDKPARPGGVAVVVCPVNWNGDLLVMKSSASSSSNGNGATQPAPNGVVSSGSLGGGTGNSGVGSLSTLS